LSFLLSKPKNHETLNFIILYQNSVMALHSPSPGDDLESVMALPGMNTAIKVTGGGVGVAALAIYSGIILPKGLW
jgi:hypothetical protein